MNRQSRSEILRAVKKLVLARHINVAGIDYDAWVGRVDERTPDLLDLDTEAFEDGVRQLLSELGSSHTAFYHDQPTRFPAQHTINATLSSISRDGNESWMFLDVFEGGPAHVAGIRPGDVLLAIDGVPFVPPSSPHFGIGRTHALTVSNGSIGSSREIVIEVPRRKATGQRPPIVEPKSLTHRMIDSNIGVLRVTYFPGAMGMRFAKDLDQRIRDLVGHGCDRLIIDLRGNIGGSLGFARLASYMCPGQIPIGHSLTPQRSRSDYDPQTLPRVPMPASRAELLLTLARFSFRDKSVMLLTQGLGKQPFHGRIVVLVNEWTNSAAEIVTGFACEKKLATILGEKTRGNVLGAANFKVGSGYWLRLPVFGWYTSEGRSLEGIGVAPDVLVEVSPETLTSGQDKQLLRATEIAKTL